MPNDMYTVGRNLGKLSFKDPDYVAEKLVDLRMEFGRNADALNRELLSEGFASGWADTYAQKLNRQTYLGSNQSPNYSSRRNR